MTDQHTKKQIVQPKCYMEQQQSPLKARSLHYSLSDQKMGLRRNLKKRLNEEEKETSQCAQCRKKDKKLKITEIQLEAVLSEIKKIRKEFLDCSEQIELISSNFSFILELASENIENKVNICFDQFSKNLPSHQEKTGYIQQLVSENETTKNQILHLKEMVHHYKQKYHDTLAINQKIENQLANTTLPSNSDQNQLLLSQTRQVFDAQKILSKAVQLRKKFSIENRNDNSPPNERTEFKSLKERLSNLKNWINREGNIA